MSWKVQKFTACASYTKQSYTKRILNKQILQQFYKKEYAK